MDRNEEIAADLLRRLGNPEVDVTIRTEISDYVGVSVLDLRAACMSNQSHPLSTVFLHSCGELNEERTVAINRIDLLALLQNRSVTDHPLGGGRYEKQLGEVYPTGSPVQVFPPSIKPHGKPDEEPDVGSTSPAGEPEAEKRATRNTLADSPVEKD